MVCGYLLLDKNMQHTYHIITTSDKKETKVKKEHDNERMSLYIYLFLWLFFWVVFGFLYLYMKVDIIYMSNYLSQKHTQQTIETFLNWLWNDVFRILQMKNVLLLCVNGMSQIIIFLEYLKLMKCSSNEPP